MSAGPPPVDRGRVFILWVLQGVAAAVFAALSLAIVIVPISENSWRVDPSTVPAGVPYEVTITTMGPWTTIRCPALIGWQDSEQPPWCSDAIRSRSWNLAAVGAAAVVTAVAWVLLRRRRLAEKYRVRDWSRSDEPVLEYRQNEMPMWFWLAAVGIGAVFTLGLAGSVVALLNGKAPALLGVFAYGAFLYEIVWVQGVRRAYRVRLDGRTLRWVTPLRSVEIDIGAVELVTIEEPEGPLLPEQVGRIEASGRTLAVTLPDPYRAWQFAGLCESLRERGIPVEMVSHQDNDG